MQVYLYAKSGHTVGLEATKRCAAIANVLKEFDPILCTSDFRAGAFAKDFSIGKCVNKSSGDNLYENNSFLDIFLIRTSK